MEVWTDIASFSFCDLVTADALGGEVVHEKVFAFHGVASLEGVGKIRGGSFEIAGSRCFGEIEFQSDGQFFELVDQFVENFVATF